MAISASTLDLLNAASETARDAANSASTLDLLRADSATMLAATLGEEKCTWGSRGSRESTDTTFFFKINFINQLEMFFDK